MQTSQRVQTVLLCFITVFMALRVFTRLGIMKGLALDDYLSILAFFVYITRAITLYVGLGDSERVAAGVKIVIANWLMFLFYTAGTWIIKLSFCVTLYRIAPSKVLTVSIIILAIATTIITIFEFFWILFACEPIRKLWEGPAVEGTCHVQNTWGISLLVHGGVLLAVDLVLGIGIPVDVLRKLRMRMLLRISVGITIAVGSLASVAGIARIYFTYRLFQIPKRAAENLNICMDVEFGVNIICTAAITLKPLLRKTGILTASTLSRSGPQSVLIFPGRSAQCGSGERGMRIQDEEEIAIWSKAQTGSLVVLEDRFSKVSITSK